MDQAQVVRPDTEAERLAEWFQGNADAVALMRDLFRCSQLADDLVDADQGHTLADRRRLGSELLITALVRIPANPAYRLWQGWLAPLIVDAVLAWDLATAMEHDENETTLAFAFVWRDQLERIVTHLAMLIGGQEHGRRVQEEAWSYFRTEHPDGQSWSDWRQEMAETHP